MNYTRIIEWVKTEQYKLLFILIVTLYIIIYAPYGLTEADDGFITGLSWRIFNGEIPYKDFIYVRPPLSPLFHSLPLFVLHHDYVIFFERAFFYISLGISSLLASKSFSKIFDFEKNKLDKYLLASVGFVFSVATFPPTAWHTVDGVLFGSIGIYFLIGDNSKKGISIGIFFLFLSALTKQSFYLMPIAGIIFLYLSKHTRFTIITAGGTLILLLIVFGLILEYFGALDEFIVQTSSASSIKEAYTAGVYKYLHSDLIFIFLSIVIWRLIKYVGEYRNYTISLALLPYLYTFFIFVYPLAFFINRIFFKQMSTLEFLKIQFRDEFATITFLLALMYMLFDFKNLYKPWAFLLLLFLSWSSSISWAHTSPHLFSTPIIMISLMGARQMLNLTNLQRFLLYLLVFGMISYFIGYQKPHYSDTKSEIVYDLSDITPALKYIKGDEKICFKLNELDSLVRKYGNNSKVLPFMPLINFFQGSISPLPIDYAINCEIANKHDKVFAELVKKRTVVFIDRDWWQIEQSLGDYKRMYGSIITYRVTNEWAKIDSTDCYYIYAAPK
ncbi:MAG: hypothetical protein J0L60_06085 [Ignavibacteria bacterium]|nr:hypothetical protein [Ignavibacteria bacterium]